jgi:hypothetical protein
VHCGLYVNDASISLLTAANAATVIDGVLLKLARHIRGCQPRENRSGPSKELLSLVFIDIGNTLKPVTNGFTVAYVSGLVMKS